MKNQDCCGGGPGHGAGPISCLRSTVPWFALEVKAGRQFFLTALLRSMQENTFEAQLCLNSRTAWLMFFSLTLPSNCGPCMEGLFFGALFFLFFGALFFFGALLF